jgi:tRNA(Ile)-lysidine synthase
MKSVKSLHNRIFAFCKEQNLISPGATIVVGLSGGPDSVFLLHYLSVIRQEFNITLIAAHLDHGWRAESGQDAAFCEQLADHYKIPFILNHLKDTNVSFKVSEELGRKARRAFFEQLAQEYNAQAIALAHHADDQMETFFLRLIRGASLTGLAGIKPKDGLYIRPLLEINKQEILNYLHEHKIPYVIDASNQSDGYLRNRIRNSVIPALKACDDRFEKNFASTHAKLIETEEFLQQLCAAELQEIMDGNRGLYIQKILELHPVMRNRVLINWLIMHKVPFSPSQGLLDEIVRFLENTKATSHTLYQKWQLIKNNNRVRLLLL